MAPTPADYELATALGALHREMGAVYAEVSRDFGLTAQQTDLLCQLNEDAPAPSFGDLARALGCDKSNITGLVDRLARRGLVRREPDPRDRRVSRVSVTAEGVELGEQMRAAIAALLAQRCGELSGADRGQLVALSRWALVALGKAR